MKKLMSFVLAVFAIIALASCSSNSPKSVAEKAMKSIVDKDYKTYVDLIYFDKAKKSPEDVEKAKEQLREMLQGKLEKSIKEKGAIKSYKVVNEEISEEGDKAVVTFEVSYEDGKTDSTAVQLVKDKDGKWWLDLGK